jgi:hypothetical protein
MRDIDASYAAPKWELKERVLDFRELDFLEGVRAVICGQAGVIDTRSYGRQLMNVLVWHGLPQLGTCDYDVGFDRAEQLAVRCGFEKCKEVDGVRVILNWGRLDTFILRPLHGTLDG